MNKNAEQDNSSPTPIIHLTAYFTPPPKQVLLDGASGDLNHLASVLERGGEQQFALDVPPPTERLPSKEYIRELVLQEGAGNVVISVLDSNLLIRGEKSMLNVLSKNIRNLATYPVPPLKTEFGTLGSHLHIEYFPDHYFLSPVSVPLVISIKYPPSE